MSELQIYNLRSLPSLQEGEHITYVKVDRSSEWGNPFIMHKEVERAYVCGLFEQYALWRLTVEPNWLKPLRGKHLACWCAPRRCHAETLRRLANEVTR